MKKIILVLFAALFVFGFTKVNFAVAQDDIQVTAGVWVLDGNTYVGSDEITIHIATPFLGVVKEALAVSVGEDACGVISISADNIGDLVIKCDPPVLEVGTYTVTVEGLPESYIGGTSDDIEVKAIGTARYVQEK